MKTRVRKYEYVKMLNFYEEQLASKFGPLASNEAIKEILRIELQKLYSFYSRKNITNIWNIPLKIEFSDVGTYCVLPENENSILIID